MPLEIKEIVVTASVTEDSGTQMGTSSMSDQSEVMVGNKEDLIAECVEQVLEILREKTEK